MRKSEVPCRNRKNVAFGVLTEQPRRRHKPSRLEAMRTEFVSCRHDATQSFVIGQVIKLALVLGVESCQELVAQSFFRTARKFMEIAVDDDFVTVRFQTSEPRHKLPVSCEEPLMMIIGHHKERTDAHTAMGEF